MTLRGTTTPGQILPGNNGNERYFTLHQIFRIGASPPDVFWLRT